MELVGKSYKKAMYDLREDILVALLAGTPGTEDFDRLMKELTVIDGMIGHKNPQLIPGVDNDILVSGVLFLASMGLMMIIQEKHFLPKNILGIVGQNFLRIKK